MPAPADDPLPRPSTRYRRRDRLDDLRPARGPRQLEAEPAVAEADEVAVRFDEAGDRQTALKVERSGRGTDIAAPTKTMRPARAARACTSGRAPSSVSRRPLRSTRSAAGGGGGLHAASQVASMSAAHAYRVRMRAPAYSGSTNS